MFLGRRHYSNGYSDVVISGTETGLRSIFDRRITGYGEDWYAEWKINNDFRNIHINSAGATVIVDQWDGDQIYVEANVPESQKINISAYYTPDDNDLYITVTPPNVSFWDITEFGVVSWLEDIFTYSGNITVSIKFPKTIYDSLNVQQGSGTLSINELYAHSNDIDIGSGKFYYNKKERFTAENFYVNLGSGSASINNAQTTFYYLDIGSGTLDIGGLTGYGSIDMGSGKCNVIYAEYGDGKNSGNGAKIDMGSGLLSLYVPEDSGIDLHTDIGSGYVEIDALGVKEKFTGDKSITLGRGGSSMMIDMGSGKVSILDAVNAPAIAFPVGSVTFVDGVFGSLTEAIGEYSSQLPGFSSSAAQIHAEPVEQTDPNEDNAYTVTVAQVGVTVTEL